MQVSDQWWFAPGHGDWSTCLEKYTLCRDGLYHKVCIFFSFTCFVADAGGLKVSVVRNSPLGLFFPFSRHLGSKFQAKVPQAGN